MGLRSPLYCTGVGKAILATLPPEEVEDVWNHSSLKKLTSRTVVDLTEMQDQLAEVRANGYAIDDEENEMGVRCVAVAIPGPDGRAESAFSISGLAPYMTPERIRRVAALALDTRTDILADLGVGGKGKPIGNRKGSLCEGAFPILYYLMLSKIASSLSRLRSLNSKIKISHPGCSTTTGSKLSMCSSPGGGEAGLQIRHVILAEGIADDPHHAVIFGKQVSVAGHRVGLLRRQAGVQRGHVGHIAGGGPGRLHGIIPGL